MRSIARWVAGVVLVLAVAWGGTWWYVQHRLRDMLVSYAAGHTAADGSSTLTYDNITTGYNPFAASATLHDLHLNLQMPGSAAPVIVSEAQLSLSLSAFSPNDLKIGLPHRLDITFPEGTINVTFGDIDAHAGVNPLALFNRNAYPLTSQTVRMQDVVILADSSLQLLTIGHLTMHEAWRNAAGPDQTALTLAIWGMPPGPYLYLPVFGPSGARDVLNLPVSYFLTPMEAAPASNALTDFTRAETGLDLVNTRANFLAPIDQVKATALDPYATFRSLYRQSRASQIQQIYMNDGQTPPAWTQPKQP